MKSQKNKKTAKKTGVKGSSYTSKSKQANMEAKYEKTKRKVFGM